MSSGGTFTSLGVARVGEMGTRVDREGNIVITLVGHCPSSRERCGGYAHLLQNVVLKLPLLVEVQVGPAIEGGVIRLTVEGERPRSEGYSEWWV